MQKLYYSISEVSDIIGEEQHTLRYWEQRFIQIKPKKNSAGKRIYSTRDIAVMKIVKKLIRDEKLSTEGVQKRLEKIIANTKDLDSVIAEIENAGNRSSNPGKDISHNSPAIGRQLLSRDELLEFRDFLKNIITALN